MRADSGPSSGVPVGGHMVTSSLILSVFFQEVNLAPLLTTPVLFTENDPRGRLSGDRLVSRNNENGA